MIEFLFIIMVLGLILLAIVAGLQRGFFAVAGSLLALLLGLAIAAVGYRPLGGFLNSSTGVVLSLANVFSYLLLIVLTQFVFLLIVRHGHRSLPRHAVLSRPNQIGGAIVATGEMILFIAVGLAIFASLPISSSTKSQVTEAPLAQPLLRLGNSMQNVINSAPGEDLTETLNLLTVDPESDRMVMLNFKTTKVQVNEAAEQQMLELINRERTSRGLSALRLNDKAREVGRSHSRDMFALGYFSHKSLDGRTPFQRLKAGDVNFSAAGENLALAPTVELAHTGLMNSPGHRANILSRNYKTVGIGIVENPRYGLMVSQEFTD